MFWSVSRRQLWNPLSALEWLAWVISFWNLKAANFSLLSTPWLLSERRWQSREEGGPLLVQVCLILFFFVCLFWSRGVGYVAKPNHNGEPVVGGSESPFRTKAHPTSYWSAPIIVNTSQLSFIQQGKNENKLWELSIRVAVSVFLFGTRGPPGLCLWSRNPISDVNTRCRCVK